MKIIYKIDVDQYFETPYEESIELHFDEDIENYDFEKIKAVRNKAIEVLGGGVPEEAKKLEEITKEVNRLRYEHDSLNRYVEHAKIRWDRAKELLEKLGLDPKQVFDETNLPF